MRHARVAHEYRCMHIDQGPARRAPDRPAHVRDHPATL
ncbi:hypothetical protein BURMUCF2_1991 [Burkholderia multivorans CF2]|nr:hypothetical protein BURMUCF2_1991 [Burkholderia multivorans CF2]